MQLNKMITPPKRKETTFLGSSEISKPLLLLPLLHSLLLKVNLPLSTLDNATFAQVVLQRFLYALGLV
jgi:hypothetical protein